MEEVMRILRKLGLCINSVIIFTLQLVNVVWKSANACEPKNGEKGIACSLHTDWQGGEYSGS
jgi:hypothetical protein